MATTIAHKITCKYVWKRDGAALQVSEAEYERLRQHYDDDESKDWFIEVDGKVFEVERYGDRFKNNGYLQRYLYVRPATTTRATGTPPEVAPSSPILTGSKPFAVGLLVKTPTGYHVVTGQTERYISEEGRSLGLDTESGTLYTAQLRPATSEEIAVHAGRKASAREIKEAQLAIGKLIGRVWELPGVESSEGQIPDHVQGETYLTGEGQPWQRKLVFASDALWVEHDNQKDPPRTHKVPLDPARDEELRRLLAVAYSDARQS